MSDSISITINISRSQISLMQREFRRYIAHLEKNGRSVDPLLYSLVDEMDNIAKSPQNKIELSHSTVSDQNSNLQLIIPQNPQEQIQIKLTKQFIQIIYSTYSGYYLYIKEKEPNLKSYRRHIRSKIDFFKALLTES